MLPDMSSHPGLHPASLVVTAGRPPREQGSPVNTPVVLSSTYVSQGVPGPELVYARYGTETWQPFEEALAALEHCRHPAIVFASGMGAIAAALSIVPTHPGREPGVLVVPRHAYQVSLKLADELAGRHGVEVRRVDVADTAQVIAALDGIGSAGAAEPAWSTRKADVILIESPTNPMLEIADLPALLSAARSRQVASVVDNTFATPLLQNPLDLGADIVVHSATKFLAGHSDVVLGACLTNDPELHTRLRDYRGVHGAIPGPFEVWLALRGLRTLALRVERAQENAAILAKRLSGHPAVVEVRHPSLPGDPGHERAKANMRGFGAVLGLRPIGGEAGADAVVAAVTLWTPGTSLGSVESLLERRRRLAAESPTVPTDFIRLAVGIENVEDLWADLSAALDSLL
jgi:cystathionine gamma-synthase